MEFGPSLEQATLPPGQVAGDQVDGIQGIDRRVLLIVDVAMRQFHSRSTVCALTFILSISSVLQTEPPVMSIKAFVSSTFQDLKHHRAEIIKSLRKSGVQIDPMEDWTSDSDEPKILSTRRMEGCQLCILLVGSRLGTFPSGETRSITQLEYDAAVKRGIAVLPFIQDASRCPNRRNARKPRLQPEVATWRSYLESKHVVSFFDDDPAATMASVQQAFARWLLDSREKATITAYLECVRDTHGWLKFLGLPQLKDNQDVKIDRLFVDPSIAHAYISPDAPIESWTPRFDLRSTIANNRELIILGDPGSGKSTAISWIAWHLADPEDNHWKQKMDARLPVPLVLRDLGVTRNVTWDSIVDSFLRQPIGRHLSRDLLMHVLHLGKAAILLDGLDEIGDIESRKALRDALKVARREFDRCSWIFTSRVVGYDQVPFHIATGDRIKAESFEINLSVPRNGSKQKRNRKTISTAKWPAGPVSSSNVPVAYVAPFSDSQIRQFATNWYAEREPVPEKARDGAQGLYDAICNDPVTHRLARTPNVLTIMALIHRIRARLPNGKALLYNEITQAYLETIDDYRKLRETNDSLADKKRWLARIGFGMQRRRISSQSGGQIVITANQLHLWVKEGMKSSNRPSDDGDAWNFIDHVRRRSGLMLERGEQVYAFVHLSFQEYFAAIYIFECMTSPAWIRQGESGDLNAKDLVDFGQNPLWRETLVFLFELVTYQSPAWHELLCEQTFGREWERIDTQDCNCVGIICLLARLVTNPHAGIPETMRDHCFKLCAEWEVNSQIAAQTQQNLSGYRSQVLQILCSNSADQQKFLDTLIPIVNQSEMLALSLAYVGIKDLSPLSRLTQVRGIYLQGTAASCLRPLLSLTNLVGISVEDQQWEGVSPEDLRKGVPELRVHIVNTKLK